MVPSRLKCGKSRDKEFVLPFAGTDRRIKRLVKRLGHYLYDCSHILNSILRAKAARDISNLHIWDNTIMVGRFRE